MGGRWSGGCGGRGWWGGRGGRQLAQEGVGVLRSREGLSTEELPVSGGEAAAPIHAHDVLMVLEHLHDHS